MKGTSGRLRPTEPKKGTPPSRVLQTDASLKRTVSAMDDAIAVQKSGRLSGGVAPLVQKTRAGEIAEADGVVDEPRPAEPVQGASRRRVWTSDVLAAGLARTTKASISQKLSQARNLVELKQIYKTLALRYHPDKIHGSGNKTATDELFKYLGSKFEERKQKLSQDCCLG